MVSNITLTDNEGNVVTIAASRCEESWINEISIVKIPTSQTTAEITTKLINLLRSIRTFIVNGFIIAGGDDSTGNFGGTDTVEQQRTKLRAMANSIRNVTFNYGSEVSSLSGGIQKLTMTENTADVVTPILYEVQLAFVVGYNLITGEGE